MFAPRSFKLCVVVDIEVTDKLEKSSKRGVASRPAKTDNPTILDGVNFFQGGINFVEPYTLVYRQTDSV